MRGFKYILFVLTLMLSVGAWGQYNPSNPAEPGAPVTQYVLTLQADPSGGGSFNLNATSNHVEGETFWVQANTASNFTFVEWTMDGEVVSTNYRFQYTMPAHNVTLIAHYRYTPSSPAEPNEPNFPVKPVYSNLWLTAQPLDGGSFNISSGTSYEVGTSVRVQANPASNFTFVNWTQDGEVISESRAFNYMMLEGADANRLMAHFTYTPGSPGEPNEPTPKKIYHRVFLMADPVGGGYFNTESGNQFEEGTQQTFRAYNNQWYTFQYWTLDGEVVSSNSSYTLTIPTEDVTLTAHYTYNYNPGNPSEPDQPTTKHLSVYGMTANGIRSQTVVYPVFLENTEDVYGVTVVVHFPENFVVNTANVVQAERAAGHTLNVEAIGNNAYRFDLIGNQPLTGQNGKIFDVSVTISTDCEPDKSYQVVLTNAARINQEGSKDVINTRNGYIFVEDMKEDGLYAQFAYEKLQNRVQFNNLSADKAISYQWDFGDGSSSTDKNPMHVYATSGYYDVTLTVRGLTGSDVAQMTVLINDESTWVVDGVFFLDTELRGVRYFTSAQDLFTFMAAHPISGNLNISVRPSSTFSYALTEENLTQLATVQQQLVDGGYTLTIAKNGEGNLPVLNFGTKGTVIDTNVVDFFIRLGESMTCDDVALQLWGIGFNPSKLEQLKGQTVLSGAPTKEVNFSSVSTDLTFTWTATTDTETTTGYLLAGEGNIASMIAMSGSAEDCHLIYNIKATYQGVKFFETTYTITLKPTLEGKFTELLPVDGAELETTAVTLSWNHINNAVYDVYLWNATNQRPTKPVAEGISELNYISQNFCQNNRSYKWQIVARNATQQLASDTMHFAVKMLPDLHIYDLRATTNLQAGRKVSIEWTVRNDGIGGTDTQGWQDRLWLVPDVYGGTSQNSCKLLATVPNTSSLTSGAEYTGHVEVTLDDYSYGSYYLLIASDMSSVNLIDWTSIGGSIVNPYSPVLEGNVDEGTYAHLFASTEAEGNLLKEHGETMTRSDNFFYTKVEIAPPSVDETDWLILEAAYHQMKDGEGWTTPWNFDSDSRSIAGLPGVQLREGRVVGINLSNNNLSGTFPTTLLKLTCLETLNLGNNGLKDDISQAMTTFMEQNPTQEVMIKTLNVANNSLFGNIGLFAQYCPQLESLNAQGNMLEEVTPMIAPKVTDLKLGKQEIDKTIVIHLNNLSAEYLLAQLPNILLYDHDRQTYSTNINLLSTTKDQSWGFQMTCQDGTLTMPYVTPQNIYYGQSGDTLNVAVVDAKHQLEGSSFNMILKYEQGDANFDGVVNILDVQTILSYMFNEWPATQIFNYSAANLFADNRINVQDIVKTVNIIISTPIDESEPVNRRIPSSTQDAPMNTAYLSDGTLSLQLTEPVTVIDLTIQGTSESQIRSMLPVGEWQCMMKTIGSQVRMVIFSPMGLELLEGTHQLLQTSADQMIISCIQLANKDAKYVEVGFLEYDPTAIASPIAGDARFAVSVYGIDLILHHDIKSAQMNIHTTDGRLISTFALQNASAGVYHVGDNLQSGTYIVSIVTVDDAGNVQKNTSKVLIHH